MTKQQKKMCEWMLEFHELCKRKKITYFLIGHQLLFAAQKTTLHGYEIDVAMYLKDWKKLTAYAATDNQFEIESVMDQGRFPGCYYRFINKNTLFLDLEKYGTLAKPGIGINVHILRMQRKTSRLLAFLEKGMEDIASGKYSFQMFIVKILELLKGNEGVGKYIESLLRKSSAKSMTVETELKEPYSTVCKFEKSFWSEKTTVNLEGMLLTTTKNYREYLIQRYGENWEKCNPEINKENYLCVVSTELPYEKYMNEINKNNYITKSFIKTWKAYRKEYKDFQPLVAKEQEGWEKTMFLAGERYRLWKKYMPLKEEILTLFEEEQYDEAELLLQDYMQVLNKYLKMNIVVCFDEEILDIVKKLYELYGKISMVRAIEEHVLEEDLKPIQADWQVG